jgi:hypothetical protein
MCTRSLTPLAASLLTAALLLAGCNKATPPPAPANPQSPAAQNQPAPQDQTAQNQAQNPGTQPQAVNNAAAPTPSAPSPAPAPAPPPPPPPPPPTLPTGTTVSVSITESLSAKHNDVGDPFTGALAQSLVHHGTTVFPRGTPVAGTVIAAKGRGRFKGAGNLGIQLTSIGGIPVHTSEYEQEEKGKGKRSAGVIGGGTGLGAIIGGVAGGGKGALIGGLAGAGAGTAGAALTGNKDIVIPAETVVAFTLTQPLTRHGALPKSGAAPEQSAPAPQP